ncbi:MAG: hypothetical protein F6K50_11355 [Moorea sp. SIO3I7]|nr:hypothetical protein [Moorena sp. SIO3I8]NEN96104.1 hypothetical protein [Moorena sp. SIO3I7]NEO05384.1 hypothetical protein [Moorena sp. SIO3I8]
MAFRPRYRNNLPFTEGQRRKTFNLQPSTFNLQPSTFNLQPTPFTII